MTQERVAPHEQSLCFAVQARQFQYSHQIHFRCWTSSTRRARIQRKIAVRDTPADSHRNGRPAMGRPTHPGSVFGLPASGAGTEAAGEQADQPDQREHGGDDEQPVHDESDAERDDRQDRQQNQQQHLSHPSFRPNRGARFAGFGTLNGEVASPVTHVSSRLVDTAGPGGAQEFSPAERARARAYHRPLYLALLLDAALGVGVLAALAWSPLGHWFFAPLRSLPPAAAAAGYAAVVTTFSSVVGTPLAFWRGWWRERRWGFSTQGAGGWLVDRMKGLGVSLVLGAAAWTAAVALARALPGWWALPAGAALALAVLFLSFVAPVVLEPLFNRFRPLEDEPLATELRGVAQRAGVPVREVLVADASRRTTKVNAYVSGIGRTRRVVLFDKLLQAADPAAVKVVVAHELGHRRDRRGSLGRIRDADRRAADAAAGPAAPFRPRAPGGARVRVALPPFRARGRPVLARAHRGAGGVRPRPHGARAAQSLRPRAAAARLPLPLQPPDTARAVGARPRMGRRARVAPASRTAMLVAGAGGVALGLLEGRG